MTKDEPALVRLQAELDVARADLRKVYDICHRFAAMDRSIYSATYLKGVDAVEHEIAEAMGWH